MRRSFLARQVTVANVMIVGGALFSAFISITWFVFTQKMVDKNVEVHSTEIQLLKEVKADKSEIDKQKGESKIELDNIKERFNRILTKYDELDKRVDELEIENAKLQGEGH